MPKTVWDCWTANAGDHPEREAIVHWVAGEPPFRWSWAGLVRAAQQISARLTDLGVRRGDVCALILRHNRHFYPLYLAVSGLGALPAVLAYPNPRLHPDKFREGLEGIMAAEKVLTLTDANFDTTLQSSQVPVLVDFWAEWCAPCKRLAPTIDAVALELDGKMAVGKLNVDDYPGVSARFGIRGIPTMILFKGGQPVAQQVGLVSKDELKKMVAAHI